jgi:uncharacterized protein (DUF2235 family)
MAKNIVLLSDGTGNAASSFFKSNVWRLYQALDLSTPQTDSLKPGQVAWYDDGVGTSSFKPLAIAGGAIGVGLKRNVIDLYTFLCRNYEQGDKIFCFGFSRGAFTIRVLAGLITNQGVVQADSEAELRRFATEAFRAYRANRGFGTASRLEHPARLLRNTAISIKNAAFNLKEYQHLTGSPPPIDFLGLWDTVDAYGMPIDEMTDALKLIIPLAIPNRRLSKNVTRACHALALDDERHTFHPVLWDEGSEPGGNENHSNIRDERISQVWFAGVHSNVGGSYPDDALAHVSLDWMMSEAERSGLVFNPGERTRLQAMADANGKLYDSRKGLGGFYRYKPRKIADLSDDTINEVTIKRPKIHESVFKRIEAGTDSYAPIGLPPHYAVVTQGGDIVNIRGVDPIRQKKLGIENSPQAVARVARQEKVWDLVWRKRIIYFLTLSMALCLAIFPFAPFLCEKQPCCLDSMFCCLAPIIRGSAFLFPDFLSRWLAAYASNPGKFVGLVSLLSLGLWRAGVLQGRIFDDMRDIWTKPQDTAARPAGWVYAVRNNPLLCSFAGLMKRRVLPGVTLLVALYLIIAVVDKGLFAIINSAGWLCDPAPAMKLERGTLKDGLFDNSRCNWASGVEVEKGKRYRLCLNVAGEWRDSGIGKEKGDLGKGDLGLEGITKKTGKVPWFMPLFVPFLRHATEPCFKPFVRIGRSGNVELPLNPVDTATPASPMKELVAEFTPCGTGELFLFVNDVVLPLLPGWQKFYMNNGGTAKVSIREIPFAGPQCE